jgi:signal transduction histidine kinase
VTYRWVANNRRTPVDGAVLSLWRAAVVYRVVTLLVSLYLIFRWRHLYAEPGVAFAIGAIMLVVTAAVANLGLRGRAQRIDLVTLDLVLTVCLTLATRWAQHPRQFHGGMPTLTTIWSAGAVIDAGIVLGTVGGVCFGALQFAASVVVRGGYDGRTLLNGLLLGVVGGLAGYITTLLVQSEQNRIAVAAERARFAERERLSRSIHDGVLQVLGLVHRRGLAAGGEWADLAQEAATQEASLRALISSTTSEPTTPDTADLASALAALQSATVTVAVPDAAVVVPADVATELLAVVSAALHNVAQHAGAGARAWIFLDVLPTEVRLSIRDDGVGIPAGRLDEAANAGRLGVATSIRGRVTDLGGTMTITSEPDDGTELEIAVPLVLRSKGRIVP